MKYEDARECMKIRAYKKFLPLDGKKLLRIMDTCNDNLDKINNELDVLLVFKSCGFAHLKRIRTLNKRFNYYLSVSNRIGETYKKEKEGEINGEQNI